MGFTGFGSPNQAIVQASGGVRQYSPVGPGGMFAGGGSILLVDPRHPNVQASGGVDRGLPFGTIQGALDSIGDASGLPLTSGVQLECFTILIACGEYDEELTVPPFRDITLAAVGRVVLGTTDSSGAFNTLDPKRPAGPPRNINWPHPSGSGLPPGFPEIPFPDRPERLVLTSCYTPSLPAVKPGVREVPDGGFVVSGGVHIEGDTFIMPMIIHIHNHFHCHHHPDATGPAIGPPTFPTLPDAIAGAPRELQTKTCITIGGDIQFDGGNVSFDGTSVAGTSTIGNWGKIVDSEFLDDFTTDGVDPNIPPPTMTDTKFGPGVTYTDNGPDVILLIDGLTAGQLNSNATVVGVTPQTSSTNESIVGGPFIMHVDPNHPDAQAAGVGAGGNLSKPFSTIQDAMDSIGDATGISGNRERYTIIVAPGVYDESVTTPKGRGINLMSIGPVIIGDGAGSDFESTTPRDITFLVDSTADFGGPTTMFSLSSMGNESMAPANIFIAGSEFNSYSAGFKISGDLIIADDGGGTPDHLLKLDAVTIEGDMLGPISVGQSLMFWNRTTVKGAVTAPDSDLMQAWDSVIDGLIDIQYWGSFRSVRIANGMETLGQVIDGTDFTIRPVGMFGVDFSGKYELKDEAGSLPEFNVDGATNGYMNRTLNTFQLLGAGVEKPIKNVLNSDVGQIRSEGLAEMIGDLQLDLQNNTHPWIYFPEIPTELLVDPIEYVLPNPPSGIIYTFKNCHATGTLLVTANSGSAFIYSGGKTADSGTIHVSGLGSSMTIISNRQGDWMTISEVGSIFEV